MFGAEINVKLKPVLDDSSIADQVKNSPLASGEGANYENMQSLTDAANNSAESLKNNASVMKEFGDIMPDLIKNLRHMNNLIAQTSSSLPSIKKQLSSEDVRRARMDEYARNGVLQSINSGSGIVQNIANGNLSGSFLGGLNATANTAGNISRMADLQGMSGLSKGALAASGTLLVGAAIFKGADALANKYLEEMPSIYGAGRIYGTTDNAKSLLAYSNLNATNKGTGLDISSYIGVAQALNRQGVTDNIGNIAQTASRWAYATGGSADQYANLAGTMARYGGSKNVASDFNYLVSAGMASGLNANQIPEFLSGIQRVMEEGISKGFSRSATEVADTLLMFSKLSGGNTFWKGEQGAKLLSQANAGIANSTSLSKTEDLIVFAAMESAYKDKEGELGETYVKNADYVNTMQLIERGITTENFDDLMGSLNNAYGDNEDAKIEALRNMTGLNYTGASRLYNLSKKGTLSESELEEVLSAPENANNETRQQENINKIKEAVVKLGENTAGFKILGMDAVSNNVEKIANHLLGDADSNAESDAFIQEFESLSPEKQNIVLSKSFSGDFGESDPLTVVENVKNWSGFGMIPGTNQSDFYSDYEKGQLNRKLHKFSWDSTFSSYANDTYGTEILAAAGGDADKATAILNALVQDKDFRKTIVEETQDKTVTSEERKKTLALMEQILKKMDEGFVMSESH